MKRIGSLLVGLSVLFFVASSMKMAFSLDQNPLPIFITEEIDFAPNLLAAVFLIPEDPATWIILVAVWTASLLFAAQLIYRFHGDDALRPADVALLVSAFVLAAIWPWVALEAPLPGFLMCVLMLMAHISIVSRKFSDERLARNPFVGILLGWATMLTFTAFSSFINDAMAIPPELASISGAILACITTMAVQMRIPHNPLCTITVMFAFLAVAAAMIDAAPIIAVNSVLAIASLTFLLVRVTT